MNNETLDELLVYQNDAFIKKAYQILLGRSPDSEGMKYYLNRLNSGVNKVEVLFQLRNSPEGKSKRVNILGLHQAIRRHKHLKTPLLGPFLKLMGFKPESGFSSIKATRKSIDINSLAKEFGFEAEELPLNFNLDEVHRLNPNEKFNSIYEVLDTLINANPIKKLNLYDDAKSNADFYNSLALKKENQAEYSNASELYKMSLLFFRTPNAHENLGNIELNNSRIQLAFDHYQSAINLGAQSDWIYSNFSRTQSLLGYKKEAITTICQALNSLKNSAILLTQLDERIDDYWSTEEQSIEFLATVQDKESLISKYDEVTCFIADTYQKFFTGESEIQHTGSLNPSRVLIVGLHPDVLPQCYRYRVAQKNEQLQLAGYTVNEVIWNDYENVFHQIGFNDLIIFYRVPAMPKVLKAVEYAKSLGKVTFYEIDDLLIDKLSVPQIETYGGQITLSAYINVTKDIGSYRAIASRCEFAIASTIPLLVKLAPLTISKKGFLHRNGLDKYSPIEGFQTKQKDYINIFYGSGTLAHNSDFLEEILPSLKLILRQFPTVKLTIMGFLELPVDFLNEFKSRTILIPFTKSLVAYSTYLSACDINLAVLHRDDSTDCKSEIKWIEAAAFSIPSVVSCTQNYLDVIRHEVDGLVVSNKSEWYNSLKILIENEHLRKQIGAGAFNRVQSEYSIIKLSQNIRKILTDALASRNISGAKSRKKIAFVNVFYPPNSMGGATRVITDQVTLISKKYSEEFEVVVFTANTNCKDHYKVNSYYHDTYRVYSVSVPLTTETNWAPKNEEIGSIFKDFLEFEQPDLVHFHCIQALTGSIVEETQAKGIPYLVTIHDAWWISDYQFLMTQSGKIYPEGHPDPFESIELREGITLVQSIQRRHYLKKLLLDAQAVLCVSENFTNIYKNNGITNVVTNKNGISSDVSWRGKDTKQSQKVVCAYLGGMAEHKGYYVFKEAITKCASNNLEVIIADHTKPQEYFNSQVWGNTPVKIIGFINQERIADFYASIDVLIAPSVCPESFGLVTREAAASGCWVVASDVGAIGEDVTNDNGHRISPTLESLSLVLMEISKNCTKYKSNPKMTKIRYSSDQVNELVHIINESLLNTIQLKIL